MSGGPIRVLRVITRLNIGGPAIHAILLTQGLDDGRVFESTLVTGVTAPHEGDFHDLAAAHDLTPIVVPALGREVSPVDDLLALASIVRLVRASRPDIVHTHMAKAGTLGRLAAAVCRVPLVVHTYHGHVFHGYFGPTKTRLFLTIERALGKLTQRIVVVGERQRDEIAAFGVAPREKLLPIPLGLELTRFLRAGEHRGQLRYELGVPDQTHLVGIVARLVPIKAHEDFLSAARLVLAERPTTRFVIVGNGERREQLEALVDAFGLRAQVSFLGWRRDLERVYADLDVVALTSRNEGSPVALIEALASARPVVATAVGGVPEVVLDGQTGVLVPPSDPAALAQAILRLLGDPSLAQRLGAAGRWHVYPRHDAGRLVDDMRALYLRELGARGRPVPSLEVAFRGMPERAERPDRLRAGT